VRAMSTAKIPRPAVSQGASRPYVAAHDRSRLLAPLMFGQGRALVIADVDRAASHLVILGVLGVIAAIAGLVYWLSRAGDKRPDGTPRSEAPGDPVAPARQDDDRRVPDGDDGADRRDEHRATEPPWRGPGP
jgi:hypothetical protein